MGLQQSVCFNRGDMYYTVSRRSPIKGVRPSPYATGFLTPRQALSSHPLKQMVRLYWLQDRDSTVVP